MGDCFHKAERRPPLVDRNLPEDERLHAVLQAYVRNYYRVLLGVDEKVGRVLDFLDKEGLADNTIVVYPSDNGQLHGAHGISYKRHLHEPSVRVPFLLHWPHRLLPRQFHAVNLLTRIHSSPPPHPR